MNAIGILWKRQLKRYVRSRSRLVASLGQPLLFLFGLGFGLKPTFERAGMGNYIDFVAPGVICMTVMFTAVFSGIELIWDRQFGFLKETLVAPVSRLSIMIGRVLGGATVAVIQGLIVVGICLLAGFRFNSISSLPLALGFMALLAILFTAFGTAMASLMSDFQGFQLVMNFLVTPMFFLSGALFPLIGLPWLLEWVAKLNPLSYGVDAMRNTLTGAVHFGLATDAVVLIVVASAFLVVGSYLFSRIQL